MEKIIFCKIVNDDTIYVINKFFNKTINVKDKAGLGGKILTLENSYAELTPFDGTGKYQIPIDFINEIYVF